MTGNQPHMDFKLTKKGQKAIKIINPIMSRPRSMSLTRAWNKFRKQTTVLSSIDYVDVDSWHKVREKNPFPKAGLTSH